MVSDGASFKKWLARVGNNNAQGEYYLTDLIALANQDIAKLLLYKQQMSWKLKAQIIAYN